MTTNTHWTFNGESVLDSNGNNACTKQNGPLIALAPEMAEALQAVAMAAADIACYCQDVQRNLRSGAGLLDLQERFAALNEQARDILARLPQKGGEK